MMTHTLLSAQSEQIPKITFNDLHLAFAELCFLYGSICLHGKDSNVQKDRLHWFAGDCGELSKLALMMLENLKNEEEQAELQKENGRNADEPD